jgi:antitoxin VapB
MSQIAKVFKSGNSQAVRLPREFRFNVEEVEISREGDAIILRPHTENRQDWSFLRAALKRGVSDDFLGDGREQPDEQERAGLDEHFN